MSKVITRCIISTVGVFAVKGNMNNNANSTYQRNVPCYFCDELFEANYLHEHVKHCSAVLEKCPHNCGVYVPRRNMAGHRSSCVAATSRRNSQAKEAQENAWKQKVITVLSLLRTAIDDGERKRKRFEEISSMNFDYLREKQECLETFVLTIMETVEEIRNKNVAFDKKLANLQTSFESVEKCSRISSQRVRSELQELKIEVANQQAGTVNKKLLDNWSKDIKDVKTFVAKESILRSNIYEDQGQRINDLKLKLETESEHFKELTSKHEVLSEKIDIIVEELRFRSDIISKDHEDLINLRKDAQANLKHLEDLIQEISRTQDGAAAYRSEKMNTELLVSTNGRLLWRIDRCNEKITDAKENDSVHYSPLFYNKEYGYALRMEIYFNGKGRWKDRHIIGSLRVENGKWDPLLEWPCVLHAVVVLRDQENSANDIRKIVKTVRRKGHDSADFNNDSGFYMFIPHTTLARHAGYTKDDVMFFDVQVKDTTSSASTLSLVA